MWNALTARLSRAASVEGRKYFSLLAVDSSAPFFSAEQLLRPDAASMVAAAGMHMALNTAFHTIGARTSSPAASCTCLKPGQGNHYHGPSSSGIDSLRQLSSASLGRQNAASAREDMPADVSADAASASLPAHRTQRPRNGKGIGAQLDGDHSKETSRHLEELGADEAALTYRAPRDILFQEMQLKLGNLRHWSAVPSINSVVLTVNAATDTRLNATEVDKRELFLFMLALEHLSGGMAVTFTRSPTTRSATSATGVTTTITGPDALTFLEKLINVVLPNQTSFEGVPLAKPLAELYAQQLGHKIEKDGKRLHLRQGAGQYAIDLRVENLLLYPDFEANFDLFEPLRSMQVRVIVDGAQSPEVASLYLAGFGLPLLSAQPKQP